MPLHAVVTVDLDNGISKAARDKFGDELKKKHFSKHKLTTLWTVIYVAGTTREIAVKYARDSIDTAAAIAGILPEPELQPRLDCSAVTSWSKRNE